jgi:hypothetical protein
MIDEDERGIKQTTLNLFNPFNSFTYPSFECINKPTLNFSIKLILSA